jgi:L-rhamnose isomerase
MFSATSSDQIGQRYDDARQQYRVLGVDTDKAIRTLAETPISLHCWQGDDVRGFESQSDQVIPV